jgi:ribose transport system permease protein
MNRSLGKLALLFRLTGVVLVYNRSFTTFAVGPLLGFVVSGQVPGLLAAYTLNRTVMAAGQNPQAAHLAGVLLSARVGGAFLDLGAPCLLRSVGAVVGGSSVVGTLPGSLFLVMAVTTMQALRLPSGLQDVAQGALIVRVLALAAGFGGRKGGCFGR